MRENTIVNIGGTFMAIDLNIEHMIGYVKVRIIIVYASDYLTLCSRSCMH